VSDVPHANTVREALLAWIFLQRRALEGVVEKETGT
jgi:hypothetical protein